MLLSGRTLVSIEWPEGYDGRYYWQHCTWVDSDDFDSNIQMYLAMLADAKLLYTTQVQMHGISYYLPGTDTLHYRQNTSPGNFGNLTAVENPNILISARWRMRGADGSYTYHLHRQPIGDPYLVDGEWSATGLTQNQTRLNTFIAQDIYRTKTGSLITSGEAANRPTMWQLRHGTKRRERRGWL